MKSLILAVLVALAVPSFAQVSGQITGSGQTQQINLVSPPANRPDGTASGSTSDREGNTKETLGHAEYTESSRRGKTFSTMVSAYTLIADSAHALTFGGAVTWPKPIVGFYNPSGSGVNAVIMNAEGWHTSGTPAGPFFLDFLCGQNWVSASSGTVYNGLLSGVAQGGSAVIPQNGQNPTTSPANTSTMIDFDLLGGPETTVLTTSSGNAGSSKDLKGRITVPPGCLFGIFAYGAGTSDVVSASLAWEEVAQ